MTVPPNKIVDRTAASLGISDISTATISIPSVSASLRRRSVTMGRWTASRA